MNVYLLQIETILNLEKYLYSNVYNKLESAKEAGIKYIKQDVNYLYRKNSIVEKKEKPVEEILKGLKYDYYFNVTEIKDLEKEDKIDTIRFVYNYNFNGDLISISIENKKVNSQFILEKLLIYSEDFEQYGFDEYVLKTLLEYCYNISKLDKNYIETVAESWSKNNIRTKQDLNNYLKRCQNIEILLKKISNIIKRKLTEYEKATIEKWLFEYNIKGEKIIELIKENKDFNKINNLIIRKKKDKKWRRYILEIQLLLVTLKVYHKTVFKDIRTDLEEVTGNKIIIYISKNKKCSNEV